MFGRSKRSGNLVALQRAYEDSYQASLRAVLLEAQNNKVEALAAWRNTKRVLSIQLSNITETPNTSQESALMSNIMDIERQCYDRISFLERGGPNNNPYQTYQGYSQDQFESHTSHSSYAAPSSSYSGQFSNFSSTHISDPYDPFGSRPGSYGQPPETSHPPPPLPPKVSLHMSPLSQSQPLFDTTNPFHASSTSPNTSSFNPFPVPASAPPVPPPHFSEYKSKLDPGSTSSLTLSESPPLVHVSTTPPAAAKPPRPPVMRRQVSRPSIDSGVTVQAQQMTPNPAIVQSTASLPAIHTSPNPAPAKSSPSLKIMPITETEGSRRTRSTSSVVSNTRSESITSVPSNKSRSPSPHSNPGGRPMLLTLRSGKGTMKRFKEERKAASTAATQAWAAKRNSAPTTSHQTAYISANTTTGNGQSTLTSTRSLTNSVDKLSISSPTPLKQRPASGPTKVVYTKPPPVAKTVSGPKPVQAAESNGARLSPATSITRPASTPTTTPVAKRPSVPTAQTPKKVAQPKPVTPVPKYVTKTAPARTASPAVKPAVKPAAKPAPKPTVVRTVKTAPKTTKPAAKTKPPAKVEQLEEELDPDEQWMAEARAKVAKVKGIDEHAAEQIFNDVVVKGDPVFWDDIAGLEKAKTSLKETVVYPFLRPDLFSGLREPAQGMLLFGPPGTGKTMLARAVASESKSTFFSISASSLTSKFLGESEKLVRALFLMARALAPSIIFVDEIDSLLAARSDSGEHETSRRIKTEFLVQWSALQHAAAGKEHEDVTRVLVLAATNLPWVIDEAARRRFVRRQYIPLPEAETRNRHLGQLLSRQKHALTPEQFEELVEMTDGFSGSDMTALAKDAAMGPLRSLGEALLTTPTDQIRPIGFEDFVASMQTIRPSVSQEGLKVFEDWAAMYGSSGA